MFLAQLAHAANIRAHMANCNKITFGPSYADKISEGILSDRDHVWSLRGYERPVSVRQLRPLDYLSGAARAAPCL